MKTIDQDEDVAIHGYTIVNQWAVDNTFFRIETVFLHHLLNDLITRCPETEKVKKFRQAKIDLYQLEAYERYIEELLEQQMKDLSGVVKDSLDVDAGLAAKQKKTAEIDGRPYPGISCF